MVKPYQLNIHPLFLTLIIATLLTGCASPKSLTYFQGDNMPLADTLLQSYSITLIPGTILYIQANSLDTNRKKNPFAPIPADPNSPPPANAVGYLVEKDGFLNLPLVGKFLASGRTTDQLADSIQTRLQKFLNHPTVLARLANLRVTILGEVNKPSTYSFNYYTMTLPQALGLAGDLTTYARRDNILIVRQKGNQRTYARLDLTNANIFSSPYYNIYPGDVIYVSPGKARAASVDRTYQILPIVLSALGVIGTIILAVK